MSKTSSRMDLKSALKTLDIATPTNIPKRIEFQAPKPPQNQAPQNEEAISRLHDLPQNEGAQIKAPQTELPKKEEPQSKPPQVEAPRKESAPSGGYYPLAHSTFRDERIRALSGDGFRVFLWMSSQAWRFRDSVGQVKAAVSLISGETGVSEASVSRILASLQTQGLIKRLRIDYQLGNLWEVADLTRGKLDPDPTPRNPQPPRKEEPQNKGTQNEPPASSKQESGALNSRNPLPQNEGHTRSIKNQENKNSLSVPYQDPRLFTYLQTVLPIDKRFSEREHLGGLRQDFSDTEIADALDYLQSRGVPGSGAPCHSPMGFLSKAMSQVQEAVTAQRQQEAQRSEAVAAQNLKQEQSRSAEEQETKLALEKEQAFNEAFPISEKQAEYIQQFAQKYPAFNALGPVIRGLAISAWWSEQKQVNRQEP